MGSVPPIFIGSCCMAIESGTPGERIQKDHPPPIDQEEISHVLASFWANYNDLTTASPKMMVSKENHPLLWPNYSG